MKFLYSGFDSFRRHKKFTTPFFAVLFTILGISVVMRGAIGSPKRTDVTVFVAAAQAVVSGENLYDAHDERGWNYVYLPLLAVLMAPVAHFPILFHVLAFYILSLAAWAGILFLSIKLVPERREAARSASIAAFLCLPVFLQTLSRGQLGIFVVFFLTAIVFLYFRKQNFWAGVLFGFACVLKISPLAVLIFYFVFKKDWKFLIGSALSGAFFVFALPSLVLGFERNWTLLKNWHLVMSFAVSDLAHRSHLWHQLLTPFAEDNQSLYAVFTRLIWPNTEHELIMSRSAIVSLGVKVLGAAGLFLLFLAGRKKEAGKERLFLEFSLYPVVMLLVSPVSETHHFTVLYLPILAALFYWEDAVKNPALRRLITAGVFAAAFGILLGLIFEKLNYFGISAWTSLFLWLALASAANNQMALGGKVFREGS